MANNTSDHVKPCNIGQSEAHNRRSEAYLARINESKIYIRRDLIPENESWVSELVKGKSLQQYYDDIARMVKEKTGRAMQTRERKVVNKKTGRVKVINGSSPLRESVVVCKGDTTIQQLRDYCERCHQQFGITAIQIFIHRDEGHYEVPGDRSTWIPNYHAHVTWDWMNHDTGKSCKLNAADMSKMQDIIAECLGMERGASKAVIDREHLERNDFIIQKQESKKQKLQEETEKVADMLENYSKAVNIKQEDLLVPTLKTNPLVNDAWKTIVEELNKPMPMFNRKEWQDERKTAIKQILTDMQTKLLNAQAAQKQEILKLGKSLYQRAMKEVNAIVKENQRILKQNERLTQENLSLKMKISAIDGNAIEKLRKEKDKEINRLQTECDKANSRAIQSDNIASRERRRADNAEGLLSEILSVPEIKELWDSIQQNKRDFAEQLNQFVESAKIAINAFAKDYEHADFLPEQRETISWAILAEAIRNELDATDEKQRLTATNILLEQVSWKGTTDYMSDLSATRTKQLCQEMTVPQKLMDSLLLASGGYGPIGLGGGGSNNELTNLDGTKKKNGWGVG